MNRNEENICDNFRPVTHWLHSERKKGARGFSLGAEGQDFQTEPPMSKRLTCCSEMILIAHRAMKDPRFIFCTILVLALAAFGFAEWQKVDELNRQIAQLKAEAAAQTASGEEETARLQKQILDRTAAITQMEEQRKTAASRAPAAKDGGTDEAEKPKSIAGDLGGMLKKMFTDPNSKKMMRGMQAMGVKMMYADLAKELGLNPDQAGQVMELLADRQMALTTQGMKIFDGKEADAAKTAEMGKDIESAKAEFDGQLESILGKDGMAKLSDYEKSVGERMQMQQYKQAFAANGLPLDDSESSGLLTIMKEERASQPASPLDPGSKDVGAAMQAMQSEETFNKLMQDREAMDRRVLTQAGKVLSPDKMVQFGKIQSDTAAMMKSQIEMARTMTKPAN